MSSVRLPFLPSIATAMGLAVPVAAEAAQAPALYHLYDAVASHTTCLYAGWGAVWGAHKVFSKFQNYRALQRLQTASLDSATYQTTRNYFKTPHAILFLGSAASLVLSHGFANAEHFELAAEGGLLAGGLLVADIAGTMLVHRLAWWHADRKIVSKDDREKSLESFKSKVAARVTALRNVTALRSQLTKTPRTNAELAAQREFIAWLDDLDAEATHIEFILEKLGTEVYANVFQSHVGDLGRYFAEGVGAEDSIRVPEKFMKHLVIQKIVGDDPRVVPFELVNETGGRDSETGGRVGPPLQQQQRDREKN